MSYQDRIDGKKAFEEHKSAEEKLIRFLQEQNVPDSLITYSLLNISTTYDHTRGDNPKLFHTNQTITVKIYDFSEYAEFQINLISSGFTAFNQNYESSKNLEGMDEAIKRAVQQAKHKAELMAAASGRKVKKIFKISDTEDTEPIISRYSGFIFQKDYSTAGVLLTDIPQTIKIEKQVKVVFDLE